jgi:hypothetical protein
MKGVYEMVHRITDIPDEYADCIVARPDGFYWLDPAKGVQFGPFPTVAQAIGDMESSTESDYEPGETLQEAEAELGISDWIDPDTGSLAEDSIPHVED